MDSLIELKEHKDLILAEEADRNWTEIRDQTYLFDRKKREVTSPVNALFQFETFKFSLINSQHRRWCILWPSAAVIVRKRKVSYRDILSVNKKFHLSSRDLKERKEINRERAQLNCL